VRIWRSDLTLWGHATRQAPGAPRAWSGLAEANLRAGLLDPALEAARRSLTLSDDFHGRELLGIILMERGDLTGARRQLEDALAQGAEHHRPELLNDLGACELALGLVGTALGRFEEARRLAPHYDRPWLNGARALTGQGRRDEALALLEAAVLAAPDSFDVWAQLAAAREGRGDVARAREARDRARELGWRSE
jgi:tetratricopeptide (TPR) repeat protein